MHTILIQAAAGFAAIGATAIAGPPPAPAVPPPVEITVPCNVTALVKDVSDSLSNETLNLTPRCVYRLTAGLPVVRHTLTFEGNDATLERSYNPLTPQFVILKAFGGTLTVRNVNFRNGNGALTIGRTARLIVDGGVFSQNTAAKGAAIFDRSQSGGPQVTDATFTANTATGFGGAIFDVNDGSGVDVTGSTFSGNTAADGGAIYDFTIRGDRISDSTFSGNSATACGAFCLFASTSATLDQVTVTHNTATESAGGGSVTSNETITVAGGEFSDNRAGGLGGGLYLSAVTAKVTGTVLTGNDAADGAGIYTDAADLIVTGGQVSANHASDHGGGIYNDWSGQGGPLAHQARNTRIIANTAGAGGGGIYDAVNAIFTVTSGSVVDNLPDNCEPDSSVTGCTG